MESKTELLATQSGLTMELEKTSANKEESSELIKVKHIVNTPFTVVTAEDKGSFVAFGNRRLTDYLDAEKCESLVIEKDWGIIMGMADAIAKMAIKEEQI